MHQYDRMCLKIRTTKEFGESTVSKILDLVENSSSRKSKIRGLYFQICTDTIPRQFVTARLALAILPPLCSNACSWGFRQTGSVWIYRALTFLVISCPCALVISIPLSFFAGIGGASKSRVFWSRVPIIWRPCPRPNMWSLIRPVP